MSAEDDAELAALVADVVQNPEPPSVDLDRITADDIADNPDIIAGLTHEELLALRKKLNPYGTVPDAAADSPDTRTAAVSYTNLRRQYLEKFVMTGLVGFLFRMVEEWEVPEGDRSWTPRKKKKKAAVAPWTARELREHAERLLELAKVAESHEAAAAAAIEEAARADEKANELELLAKADPEKDAARAQREAANASLAAADEQLASARGCKYATLFEIRRAGIECDKRIDEAAAAARQHPKIRAEVDRNPVDRKTQGQLQMPAAKAKAVIKNFLRAWFEFNPDAHVRSAHDEVVIREATERKDVEGLLRGPFPHDAGDPDRLPLEAVLMAPPQLAAEPDVAAFQALTVSQQVYNAACCLLRNQTAAEAFTRATASDAARERFRRALFPVTPGAARAAAEVVPPVDTFFRWRYYMEHNYEQLRSAVEAIYHDKPDLDWALLIYETFAGNKSEVKVAFDEYKKRYEDEIVSDLRNVEFGKWTLLGDFKENRKKIEFYNKHTAVIERILDRHADDAKLGKDLMKKRVHTVKAQNIKEAGPDDPGLGSYRANYAKGGSQGAKKVISQEEMLRLEKARGNLKAARELEAIDEYRAVIKKLTDKGKVDSLNEDEMVTLRGAYRALETAKEMLDVPDDAIQVDVWTNTGGKLEKSKFYTKAEAPDLAEDGAPPPSQRLAPHAQSIVDRQRAAERAALDVSAGGAKK